MLAALLRILVTLPFVAALLWLTFANRDAVPFIWDPLHAGADEMPLAIIIVCATVAGFMWGGLIVWLNQANVRRERRHQARELNRLEKELEQARTQSKPATDLNLLKTS